MFKNYFRYLKYKKYLKRIDPVDWFLLKQARRKEIKKALKDYQFSIISFFALAIILLIIYFAGITKTIPKDTMYWTYSTLAQIFASLFAIIGLFLTFYLSTINTKKEEYTTNFKKLLCKIEDDYMHEPILKMNPKELLNYCAKEKQNPFSKIRNSEFISEYWKLFDRLQHLLIKEEEAKHKAINLLTLCLIVTAASIFSLSFFSISDTVLSQFVFYLIVFFSLNTLALLFDFIRIILRE